MHTLAVNTIAPLMLSRVLLPQLRRASKPRIVAVSSQMGALHRDSSGMYAYRSSKAALNKVMQTLANELKAEGIIVCPVHPGWVRTDMGGEHADISVERSAEGIVQWAQGLNADHSGRFFNWQGDEHVW